MDSKKKQYTSMSLKHSYYIGREDKARHDTISVAMEALLSPKLPVETTSVNGQTVCRFRTPISNRGELIERMCGRKPFEKADSNGNMVCWASVTAWGRTADRLSKFAAMVPTCKITIVGNIQVVEASTEDGNTGVFINITLDDFWLMRSLRTRESAGAPTGDNNVTDTTSPEKNFNSSDIPGAPQFSQLDEYDPDGDDELPF